MHRDELRIPAPCSADWNTMEPRDKARFCESCSLEVLDVSSRTEREVRDALRLASTSRVCLSYETHRDGSVRTKRDPYAPDVPLRSLSRRGVKAFAVAAIALAACSSTDSGSIVGRTAGAPIATVEPGTTEGNEGRVNGGVEAAEIGAVEPCEPRTMGEIAPVSNDPLPPQPGRDGADAGARTPTE